ncbi:uncharacterized protein LOC127882188 isoform X3 [Dreissena polymorpha]|uniref:N-acetyltransferase domain-containing protein n=1 Tax=Dreissena polymorpha TaxID=45954 RepID=A0A9D4GMT8_DREPO|nr:uncharacterized protein LOC127882188 isoform X3 [Dreissena polymorpha]KAH3818458.1 hypothetical protein DPMN_120179 [Dreissena polymorpha]
MAYHIKSKKSVVKLPYLPFSATIKDGTDVLLDSYRDEHEQKVYEILKHIVNVEGDSYPQEDMTNIEDFRAYYLTLDVFVCLEKTSKEVLGAFYIKPNFPGRCSHICNAGFIVKVSARGRGVGNFMAEMYLRLAKDLGYRASFFNLVFVTNEASVRLWRKLGFKEIGRVPNVGNLKGKGYTDALQFYYDFTA